MEIAAWIMRKVMTNGLKKWQEAYKHNKRSTPLSGLCADSWTYWLWYTTK